jgi:hypothetical protein
LRISIGAEPEEPRRALSLSLSPPMSGNSLAATAASPMRGRAGKVDVGSVEDGAGVRLVAVPAMDVVRELLRTGIMEVACATAAHMEREDLALGQLFIARFLKISHVLSQLDVMVHTLTMQHLIFWRPLARSSWAKAHPVLLARLMCNPASHPGPDTRGRGGGGTEGGGRGAPGDIGQGFRVVSEVLVRKLRLCMVDEPSLSLAVAVEAMVEWARALRPVALRFRDVVAAFSQSMREEAFIGELIKAEARMTGTSRAVFQGIVGVQTPVRLLAELLWALQEDALTPADHCDALLLPELRGLAATHSQKSSI